MAAQDGIRKQHRRTNPRALSPTGTRSLDASSRRACSHCRATSAPNEMILLSPISPVDARRRSYLCAKRSCIFGWAERVKKSAGRNFCHELKCIAERRLIEALGLARRQNQIVSGTERLTQILTREGKTLFSATNAAPRTLDRYRRLGAQILPTPLDGAALGHAIGQAPIAALLIEGGRHAQQAAHWLRVWYEAHPTSRPESEQQGPRGPTQPVATKRDTIDDVIEVVR